MTRATCADCGAWWVGDAFSDSRRELLTFMKAHYRVEVEPDYAGREGVSPLALQCEFGAAS